MLEWYWILLIIFGFFAAAGLLVYLGMKGILGKVGMNLVSKITSGLSVLVTTLAAATESKAVDIVAFLMQLVEKAVLAAENAYYNDEITSDERYARCMKYFDQYLLAAGVTLTLAQRGIIDSLVKAACEDLGHGMVAAKTAELVTENEAALADQTE